MRKLHTPEAREDHILTLQKHIGKAVLALRNVLYLFNGEVDAEDFGDFEIETESGVCHLTLLGDGQSVAAIEGPAKVSDTIIDSQNQTATWRKTDIVQGLNHFLNQRIVKIEEVIERGKSDHTDSVIGYRLSFAIGYLVYMNWGDDAKLMINNHPVFDSNDQSQLLYRAI